ncbi:MAG: transposase [Patescibacteria group bacterium]|nr:transposase [Patescibacteria group bacterium]
MRKTVFAKGEYYHIYNRGVDKRKVFMDSKDYSRFLKSMKEFNNNLTREGRKQSEKQSEFDSERAELVDIIVYCLNPNHYHFILKQREENGVVKFMQKLGTGYTNYFNKKYDRSGALFQGKFKSIHIDSNEYLLYLSAYINKNHFIHSYKEKEWIYSSELDYTGKRNYNLCKKDIILKQFRNGKEYQEFMDKNATYLRGKKRMGEYLLE